MLEAQAIVRPWHAARLSRRSRLIGAAAMALGAGGTLSISSARAEVCPAPTSARSSRPYVPLEMRLHDPDPAFRDMAGADLLMKKGRRAEAAAVYRRYVTVPEDHRQTARRAQLKLAQVAIDDKDFAGAERLIALATGAGAPSELVERGRYLTARMDFARSRNGAEDGIAGLNALIDAGRYDEALRAGQALLQRPCPYPLDYRARVRTRLAQVHRARQDFPAAKAMALQAKASAMTPKVRQGATKLIAEIDAAAYAARLRANVARASDMAEAGDRPGAIAILQPLVLRSDVPGDIANLARLRLAHVYRAQDEFPRARELALLAHDRATSPTIRQSAATLVTEIDAAAYAASLRAQIASANGFMDSGNPAKAVQLLEPIATGPDVPPAIAMRARLRLAHAYLLNGQFDSATALLNPLLADPALDGDARSQVIDVAMRVQIAKANALMVAGDARGAQAILEPVVARSDLPEDIGITARMRLARAYSMAGRYDEARGLIEPLRSAGRLTAENSASAARIYLSRAEAMVAREDYAAADPAFREVLAWAPPTDPEVRDSARLGLARSLDRTGQRRAARDLTLLVRNDAVTPRLRERAVGLLSDIEGDIVPGRLVGFVQAGVGFDSNAPARISAQDENGDDVAFPANQRFSDGFASVAGKLQYRAPLGASNNTLDFVLAAERTFQFELTSLDRTRIDLTVGPSIATAGLTRFLAGGSFSAEWRGSRFRASEPGIYVGLRTDLGANLSLTALYTLGFHNDYRPERDGTDHQFDALFRLATRRGDVARFNLRATREGAHVDTFRDWRLRAAADWNHSWQSNGRLSPYIALGASVERVIYDGVTLAGVARRDWKLGASVEAGVQIDTAWRASLRYAYYDISSTLPARDVRPDHQVGLTLRYAWN